ncbi:hypothetical protein LTS14_005024 [Recurvomyces mirabilis]|nr:hypothetical protein LTS14_005024 [Recurvomyces mirabilis]
MPGAIMIYSIISKILLPFVLLFSIPLVALSIATSVFAFWVLLIRVSIVYVELLAALLWSCIIPEPKYSGVEDFIAAESLTKSPDSIVARSRRASRSSAHSESTYPRLAGPSGSAVTLPEPLRQRDYEGVGGWRDEGEDDAIWLGMNSRLELPLSTLQCEHLSQTSLHLLGSGYNSPERVRTPHALRTPGSARRHGTGTESPESYFSTAPGIATRGHQSSQSLSGISRPGGAGSTTSPASINHSRRPTH